MERTKVHCQGTGTTAAKAETPSNKKRKINNGKTEQLKITDFHESSTLSPEKNHEIDRACVRAFVICGIPWHIIENPFL